MIKTFDKAAARLIAEGVESNLQEWAEENGLTVERGSGSFTDSTFTMKVSFTVKGADPQAAHFGQYARTFGLEPEDLGKQVVLRGAVHNVVGLDIKRRTRPVVVERVSDGRRLICTVESILHALGRGPRPVRWEVRS